MSVLGRQRGPSFQLRDLATRAQTCAAWTAHGSERSARREFPRCASAPRSFAAAPDPASGGCQDRLSPWREPLRPHTGKVIAQAATAVPPPLSGTAEADTRPRSGHWARRNMAIAKRTFHANHRPARAVSTCYGLSESGRVRPCNPADIERRLKRHLPHPALIYVDQGANLLLPHDTFTAGRIVIPRTYSNRSRRRH